MRNRILCIRLSKKCINLLVIFLIIIVIICCSIIRNVDSTYNEIKIENNNQNKNDEVIVEQYNMSKNDEYVKKESKILPSDLEGYKVIGKIQIPKINLDTYILEETNTKSLNVSVTKLCGPNINEIGNFCITGHNYNNNKMFGKINKLEKGDKIILTDIYGRNLEYYVYDKFQTNPRDTSCLSQDTDYDRELTLITCTIGAINRIIIKAIEVYD